VCFAFIAPASMNISTRHAILFSSAPRSGSVQQVETRNPYQPPCLYALYWIQPQPRDRRALSLIGLRAL
jgi:hypothetical protein